MSPRAARIATRGTTVLPPCVTPRVPQTLCSVLQKSTPKILPGDPWYHPCCHPVLSPWFPQTALLVETSTDKQ